MNEFLLQLGWDNHFQQSFEGLNDDKLVPGRVVRENRGQYIVSALGETGIARLPGKFLNESDEARAYPTVGDWLALKTTVTKTEYVVHSVLPRRTLFERQVAGDESVSQLVAANFDFLFLVNGLDGDLNPRRIQRYLSLASASGAEPVVVLNKVDLLEDLEPIRSRMAEIASQFAVHFVSARDAKSLDSLAPYLTKGKTVALLGSSGVGKSTLINALIGEERLATRANRESDNRGRHTTTWRELIVLPHGGVLIDLPGMRELQLTGEAEGIQKTFTEIETLAKACRFRDCRHDGEPGCAVAAAIKNGEIDEDRLSQYHKLKDERSMAQARTDQRARMSKGKKGNKYLEKEERHRDWAKQRRALNNAKKRNWND